MNEEEKLLEKKLNECYGVIYLTANLVNGKTYVGQTKQKGRFFQKYLGSGLNLQRAISKYGKENFKKEIIAYCKDKQSLDEAEIHYIEEINPDYNIVGGGYGGDIYNSLSPESKERFIQKIKDNWNSKTPEEKALHRKKQSDSLIGHFVSEEQKKKTKESNIEYYMLHGTFIVLEDTELKTKEVFYSLRQAVRETGLNISFFTKRLKDSNFIARKLEYRTKKVRYATEEERSYYIKNYYINKKKNEGE